MAERFETHARTVSLLTLASRVTGLARDAALSRIFGAAGLMDAFVFAFMIPNLFRRLFGEGALAAAFLPVYGRLRQDDPDTAQRLASLTVAMLMIVLGGVTLVGEGVLFAISQAGGHENLAVWLMMIMLPYMPMVCLVAILGAMLQVHGRFGPTAAAPIVLNLCLIAAAIGLAGVFEPEDQQRRIAHIGAVAGSVIVSGVLQVAWLLWALRRQRWWVDRATAAGGALRRIVRQAVPMVVGLGVLQLNTFLDGLIASYPTVVGPSIFGLDYPLREGALASVNFAQRLYQFPLGVFGIAVATAIFPALARVAEDGDAFVGVLRRGLRLVVLAGLPATAGLILVRGPLTSVIYQGGHFTAADAGRVQFILIGYASAVWAYSMIHVLTRAYYARGEIAVPVKVALSMVGLNLALNCTLIWTPLREAGLAWSTAICAVIQVCLLAVLLRRRVERVVDRSVMKSWGGSAVIAALMCGGVWLISTYFEPAATWRAALLELLVLVGAGVAIVVLGALAFRMPELRWLVGDRGTKARRHEGTK